MPSKKSDNVPLDGEVLIGDLSFEKTAFEGSDDALKKFTSEEFRNKTSIERNKTVNETLLELIMKAPAKSYLLCELLDYLQRVTENNILDGNYNQTAFEHWLNQHSGLSYEENRQIRGKIVGKYIPRDEFQTLFPVGHEKVYNNSHIVTAHNPPDLDSSTASFVGWLDAFACRVGGAMTIWNMPQGQPGPVISKLFLDLLGPAIFTRVAKAKAMISPVAMDLVRQNRLIRVAGESNIRDFRHNRHENHIILVDEDGYYVGDWRVSDVDSVGHIQRLLNICLNIFEKQMVRRLTDIFTKKSIQKAELEDFIESILNQKVPERGLDLHRLNSSEYDQLDAYLKKVLKVENGCQASLKQFFDTMDEQTGTDFNAFESALRQFINPDNFDLDECFNTNTANVFSLFNEAYTALIAATRKSREHFDRIDVAMAIKSDVLGRQPSYLTTKAEYTEIVDKIKDYRHISVCFPDKEDRLIPVGVIHREDVEKAIQGTVTMRDFCNFDEIKVAKCIEVISAIDHHKSTINSKSCMTITVADVQSANVLTAEKAFFLNDRYGTHGQSLTSIDEQIKELQAADSDAKNLRLFERLIKKKQAHHNAGSQFFVSPERETQEYLFFLNAIIDDTDLLSKSGWRDIICVCELINRLKSIMLKKEVEVLDVTHYPRTPRFLKNAIQDVLTNQDTYSFYKGIYNYREEVINTWMLDKASLGRCFEDRKIQNETCCVSQFKIFSGNRATFNEKRFELLQYWFSIKNFVRSKSSEVDFFLHMISTIAGGKEAYEGKMPDNGEEDEIWLSVNYDSDQSTSRFRQFLEYLKDSPKFNQIKMHMTIEGPASDGRDLIAGILRVTVPHATYDFLENDLPEPIVVFKFKQGTLNSRKADITPFLPN
ncbi:MAG: hypothetical protein MK132_01015 [Lentisphaerales bacterium]|nr:hypothetical protein [Lentisphaerales bacterium]